MHVLNASTSREIDAAFATLERARPDALFVAPEGFFNGQRVKLVTLAAHHGIPATYAESDFVKVGGLMSYGTDITDIFRQIGFYTGRIVRSWSCRAFLCSRMTQWVLHWVRAWSVTQLRSRGDHRLSASARTIGQGPATNH
jgi:ABC-type uncharacterized transport system substrate-binding protein